MYNPWEFIVGQVKKNQAMLKDQEKHITEIGKNIIGYTGNTFDPILEKYIGCMVIAEIKDRRQKSEKYCGIFKEYSKEFIEILSVQLSEKISCDESTLLHSPPTTRKKRQRNTNQKHR